MCGCVCECFCTFVYSMSTMFRTAFPVGLVPNDSGEPNATVFDGVPQAHQEIRNRIRGVPRAPAVVVFARLYGETFLCVCVFATDLYLCEGCLVFVCVVWKLALSVYVSSLINCNPQKTTRFADSGDPEEGGSVVASPTPTTASSSSLPTSSPRCPSSGKGLVVSEYIIGRTESESNRERQE